jgi:hypothetical protein
METQRTYSIRHLSPPPRHEPPRVAAHLLGLAGIVSKYRTTGVDIIIRVVHFL